MINNIMVGRRTRAGKTSTANINGIMNRTSNNIAIVTNGYFNEDQYFASPKRKDCKIDELSTVDSNSINMYGKSINHKPLSPSHNKTKTDRHERIIGVPLATRSQTRTIENYFKANTATKNLKKQAANERGELNTFNKVITLPSQNRHLDQNDIVDLTNLSGDLEDYTYDMADALELQQNIMLELDDETNDIGTIIQLSNVINVGPHADFSTHRSTLRDSHSSQGSNTTDNIFLQEPVLKLDVDKSPNQASSIKIKKSLEVEPIFSSPPKSTSLSSTQLNGRFNQIVSLNCPLTAKHDDEYGLDVNPRLNGIYMLITENENVSFDNNNSIIVDEGSGGAMQTRHRKPATPHRIVCPSPIKTMSCVVTQNGNRLSPSCRKLVSSPRKSQRHSSNINTKTRRRLNEAEAQKSYQNGLNSDENDDDLKEIKICKDITEERIENSHVNGKKLILNSTQHPTAEQNTKNNILIKTTKTINKKETAVEPKMQKNKFTVPKTVATTTATSKSKSTKPLATTNGNLELTEFFPVRRSVRKTKTAVKEEEMRNLVQAVLEERDEGLRIENFDGKGRGVVADRLFRRGEFVIEYDGDLISMDEAQEREKRYALDENTGCYMYYFKHADKQLCIDATAETGKFGRLLNHSRNGNLMTRVVVVKQRPHLVLIANKDIEAGEELTYDYGDRSKEALLNHPWLAY